MADTEWPAAFNAMIEFRRRLRDRFGVPVRMEVKATYLVGGSGPFRALGLAPAERALIFRAHLRELRDLNIRAFAVVIDKRSPDIISTDVGRLAWETVVERLERTSYYENVPFTLVHDEGPDLLVRKVARKARRRITAGSAFGAGQIVLAATRFVDDRRPGGLSSPTSCKWLI